MTPFMKSTGLMQKALLDALGLPPTPPAFASPLLTEAYRNAFEKWEQLRKGILSFSESVIAIGAVQGDLGAIIYQCENRK